MSMPVLFEFEALPVRVMTGDGGEHWFCAKDICTVLGYSNTSQTIGDHCREKGISKRYTLTEKGQQELQFVDEGNLYRLIIKSRKGEAKRFESWVCDEVLPALHKSGGYHMTGSTAATSRISNHRLRLSLAKELFRARDFELRQLIHQQLADVSNALRLPVPELDSLSRAAPRVPDVVQPFWQALAFLDGKGAVYNHTRAENLVAVNLPELARLLIEQDHPVRFDSALRQAL
ncbi:BRO-N domain-containing protein [Pseudomonas soli]|uniref:BRO-N domain-containing protein n=1 Tax=Pseudomonas soli TaxID=1306993 RepID=UPI00380CE12C